MKRCPSCGAEYDGAAARCPLDAAVLVATPAALPAPEAGLTFDAWIGDGALADVYAAIDASGRRVAVKRLKAGPSKSPTLRERFVREARLASRIESPHVVRIHDVVEAERPMLVMELVDGPSLHALLAAGKTATELTVTVGADVAAALAAAHASGVLHRDVKPANVIVSQRTGRAKLTDLGLARVLGDDRLTATGELLGTPRYLAPEAALGKAEPASDVYSLGCVLFELVSGRPPFTGTVREILVAHATAAPPSLGAERLAALVASMLEKAPADRPTARDVVDRLRAANVT